MSLPAQIPATPRVISPSPTPSENGSTKDYFGPVTRSSTRKRDPRPDVIDEELDGDLDTHADLQRARTRSRETVKSRSSGLPKANGKTSTPTSTSGMANGAEANLLSPSSANRGWSWRDLSRSPSPLGLIPIHRHWRLLVHKYEIPRKLLHVSIGFLGLWLYVKGVQTTSISPKLMIALVPIATIDFVRFTYPPLNRAYVQVMGILMRETEYDGWNGVIWYLLGVWIVLTFFPKDVGLMGVLLLSWCDTAASTIGRAYGRYTPRIRKGKSLAGSLAALFVGVVTAATFWGYIAPHAALTGVDDGWPFMFTGTLSLPSPLRDIVGWSKSEASVRGGVALAIMSLYTGFAASASEMVDLFSWDDNLTIPVLSGIAMWAFLKVFG